MKKNAFQYINRIVSQLDCFKATALQRYEWTAYKT